MIFKKYMKPFPHVIVDTFFTDSMIALINDIFVTNKHMFTQYTHRQDRYGIDLINYPIVLDYINDLKDDILESCRTELELRFENRMDPSNFKLMEHKLCLDAVGYSIPKHCDTLQKAVSIVIYVNGLGSTTTLYDNTFNTEKNVKNLENSALIFVPNEKSTWHEVKETLEERHTIQIMFEKLTKES